MRLKYPPDDPRSILFPRGIPNPSSLPVYFELAPAATGPTGPTGPSGPTGPTGPAGH
jgi:hypothetical protein